MALKLNEAYPGRFNNPSADYPQGSFKNRTAPDAQDGSYFEQRWANDQLALFSALLDAAEIEPSGEVDKVGASQYFDALLKVISDNAGDTLNAPIATVAAANNINLSTGAPSTSQLLITGTGVSINGFTVAANRALLVKFAGANTLVNSGSLVTNTGANLVTAAGDSCWLRATAANTVEVLDFKKAVQPSSLAPTAFYKIFADGSATPYIRQGGSISVAASTDLVITLPVAFSTANICPQATGNSTTGVEAEVAVTAKSLTSITVRSDVAQTIYWTAEGY